MSHQQSWKEHGKTYLSRTMKPSFDFYWSLSILSIRDIDLHILVGVTRKISENQGSHATIGIQPIPNYLMHISLDVIDKSNCKLQG
jgi:hypothetical protein